MLILASEEQVFTGLCFFAAALLLFVLSGIVVPSAPKTVLRPEQLKLIREKYIVPPEVQAVLGTEVQYSATQKLDEEKIPGDGFLLGGYGEYQGSQLMSAVYRGLPIEMCHTHFTARGFIPDH